MTRILIRRFWPGLLALAWLLQPTAVQAWGNTPIPISTDSVFVYRFDIKIGPSAFARPAGPWYSYFPIDPNLLAQPQTAAFPNWPTQFPTAPPQSQPVPRPVPGMTYYQQPANPYGYGYGYGVYPAGYYAPQPVPAYWYQR
jgi:hypothetical protein